MGQGCLDLHLPFPCDMFSFKCFGQNLASTPGSTWVNLVIAKIELQTDHYHGFRETVRLLLRVMDPDGVRSRRRGQLCRRVYRNSGPNFLIHVDGYDKIKRFGFAIHGAIDGYVLSGA